jgi:hypothetical protein
VHFTPTSASWLNLVERFFSTLSEKWIKRQTHTSVKDLESSIEHYLATYNQNPRPFRWHKGADEILVSMLGKKLCRLLVIHHTSYSILLKSTSPITGFRRGTNDIGKQLT